MPLLLLSPIPNARHTHAFSPFETKGARSNARASDSIQSSHLHEQREMILQVGSFWSVGWVAG